MSTSRDYASQDPRSFARWLREGERCAPEKPLTHPDYSPRGRSEVDEMYQLRNALAWREVRGLWD